MKIGFTIQAYKDYEEIFKKLNDVNPQIAEEFDEKLDWIFKTLPKFPELGRMVPERMNPQLREILWKNYRIVYQITHEMIEIITIFSGRRQLSF